MCSCTSFLKVGLLLIIASVRLLGQQYITADPFNILETEKELFDRDSVIQTLMIRPLFIDNSAFNSKWSFNYRSELYYNSNAPNLENTSDKWIGKGLSSFNSINISYYGKYLAGSIEPFYFINQNKNYNYPRRISRFSRLNDNPAHTEKPYDILSIRESQLYLHYKGIGAGLSNANMWWGSGIHSSIMMTNNTTGFGHIFLGTINEKVIGKFGINARYIFARLDHKNKYEPFFNAIALSFTYYSEQILTFGLTRSVLAGGKHPFADQISKQNARFLVFSGYLFAPKNLDFSKYTNDDNTMAAYLEVSFPKSKLKLFLEAGRTDIAWDIYNLILAPDYSIATIIGFRKFGLFNNKQIYFGFEYFKQLYSKYENRLRTGSGNWYSSMYDNSTYNGRAWGPHSGEDSDDFFIFTGWIKNNYSINIIFNYERHGLQKLSIADSLFSNSYDKMNNIYPEVKIEFKLRLKYKLKGCSIYFMFEKESLINYEFIDNRRRGFVLMIGIEKRL